MIVTRYLSSHLEETLASSEIKVAKVSDFNDAFEFRCRYDGEYGRTEAIQDLQKQFSILEFWEEVRQDPRFAGQTDDSIVKQFQQNLENMLDALATDAKSGHKEIVDNTHQAADETTRIICYSKPSKNPYDDMLRWSHYTNCHKGSRIWLDLSTQEYPLNIGYPINYSTKLITIDVARMPDREYYSDILNKVMITKAKCWEYEDEVRSIIPNEFCVSRELNGAVVDFVGFKLKGVVRIDFGIRFPEDQRLHLIKTYKSQLSETVSLFQATRSYSDYRIEYNELK
jgi:hypothetical protein